MNVWLPTLFQINLSEKPPVAKENVSPEPPTPAIHVPEAKAATVTPVFNINPTPPESMTKYNNDVTMPTPPRFYTETARRMFCDAEMANIPKPEVEAPRPRERSGLNGNYEVTSPGQEEVKKRDEIQLSPRGLKAHSKR
jgi:hypothetical protein